MDSTVFDGFEGWVGLWKVVFCLGIAIFAVMAVWVTIQGARDIKKLFRTLNEEHGQPEEETNIQ